MVINDTFPAKSSFAYRDNSVFANGRDRVHAPYNRYVRRFNNELSIFKRSETSP